jgi:hypothetical protein
MRPSTLTLGLVVTGLAACGGRSLGTSGAGGTTAGTGEGATGGTGGTRSLPACGERSTTAASVAILESDGTLVATSVTEAVSVTAIETCPSDTCTAPAGSYRMSLAGAAPALRELILTNTAMPSDVVGVGDELDLTIEAAVDQTLYRTVDQTIVLSRDGDAILFAAKLQRFGSPPLPNLLPFGIAVSDAGPNCESTSTACGQRSHALRVSVATDAALVLGAGHTGTIGGVSITNGGLNEFVDAGGCDTKSTTLFAGFRLP